MRYVLFPLAFVLAGVVLLALIIALSVGISTAFVVYGGLEPKDANVAAQYALLFLMLFGAGLGVARASR